MSLETFYFRYFSVLFFASHSMSHDKFTIAKVLKFHMMPFSHEGYIFPGLHDSRTQNHCEL